MASITLHKDGGISVDGRRCGEWHQHWPAGTDRSAIRYRATMNLPEGHTVRTGLMRWGELKGLVRACLDDQSLIDA